MVTAFDRLSGKCDPACKATTKGARLPPDTNIALSTCPFRAYLDPRRHRRLSLIEANEHSY